MARPIKWRRIENMPSVAYFAPSDGSGDTTQPENKLKLEELEAIRLKDLEGLEQGECAERMGVSRPTFQRILLSAREKVADSLVGGKALRIGGGNFTRNICAVHCNNCGREWVESFENIGAVKNGTYVCSECQSTDVVCEQECPAKFCRGNCRRHGRRDG